MIGDGTCDSACYNEGCDWDKTDCASQFCVEECTPTLLNNYICDQECNTADCNYYESNCLCAPACDPAKLGDSNCDADCNTTA
mmetsp:Transcript_20334/g.37973  ORF Transcript_20334/g.37973 Transcript_20334/m.37973 type:complete len:83 (-) Transcript_20334:3228-3476(-)